MKKISIVFLIMTMVLLLGSVPAYSDRCPDGSPPAGCSNWTGLVLFHVPIVMDDGDTCLINISLCKRCCSGYPEYYLESFFFDDSTCYSTHGLNLNGSSFHNQIANLFLNTFSLCDSTPTILPCPGNGTVFARISFAPCYRWARTLGGTYTLTGLVACSDSIGCSQQYKVCWNGTNFEWTYIGSSYSALCPPPSPGVTCFGICRED